MKLLPIILIFLFYTVTLSDTLIIGEEYDIYEYQTKRRSFSSKLPKNRDPNDFTPLGFVKQPSFIRGGGSLARHEHAFVFYLDGDVIPFTPVFGYRWGWLFFWDWGIDIHLNSGVFQAMLHTRAENFKTKKSEFFFWANAIKSGYKYHNFDFNEDLRFDDKSWLTIIENSFGFRLGAQRRKVIYLNTLLYIDYDLHTPQRQTDYYITPIVLGFEAMAGEHGSFFAELGIMYGITGMEFGDGTYLYKKDWFPVFKIGTALRSGKKSGIYYAVDTKPLAIDRNRKKGKRKSNTK